MEEFGGANAATVRKRLVFRPSIPLLISTGSVVVLILLAVLLPSIALAAECTNTWSGPAEGSWQTASNWSAGHLPTSGEVACIGAGKTANLSSGTQQVGVVQGEGAVKLSGGSLQLTTSPGEAVSSLSTFKLTGGTLTGIGTLNVTGSFSTGGTNVSMTGTGKTVVKPGATAELKQEVSGGSISINERTLVNEGTLTFSVGNLYVGGGAVIENSGTFRANSEPTSVAAFRYMSGAAPLIVNTGNFEKTAGTGTTEVALKYENKGATGAKSGRLSLTGGGSSSSSSEMGGAEGGKVVLGSYSLGESKVGGALTISGTVTGQALSGSGGQITLSSGTLNLSGEPSSVSTFNLTGGTLTGAGTLNVTGSFTTGGTNVYMTGTGKTVVKPGATAELK
ncbi:MAG TPA: hypothetical protein VHQ43_10300, partial [Solirubrobacterales bacterium]|nr:hypothetical protein [Solirubrobacterales bacterium]